MLFTSKMTNKIYYPLINIMYKKKLCTISIYVALICIIKVTNIMLQAYRKKKIKMREERAPVASLDTLFLCLDVATEG